MFRFGVDCQVEKEIGINSQWNWLEVDLWKEMCDQSL